MTYFSRWKFSFNPCRLSSAIGTCLRWSLRLTWSHSLTLIGTAIHTSISTTDCNFSCRLTKFTRRSTSLQWVLQFSCRSILQSSRWLTKFTNRSTGLWLASGETSCWWWNWYWKRMRKNYLQYQQAHQRCDNPHQNISNFLDSLSKLENTQILKCREFLSWSFRTIMVIEGAKTACRNCSRRSATRAGDPTSRIGTVHGHFE